jgi:hypothetical protein
MQAVRVVGVTLIITGIVVAALSLLACRVPADHFVDNYENTV